MSTAAKTKPATIEACTGTVTINGVAYRTIRDHGIFYHAGDVAGNVKGYLPLGMSLWTKVVWDAV